MQRRMVTIGVVAGVLALVVAGLCLAQPRGRQGGGGRAAARADGTGGGPGGQFDPAQMRQRMMERWKERARAPMTRPGR